MKHLMLIGQHFVSLHKERILNNTGSIQCLLACFDSSKNCIRGYSLPTLTKVVHASDVLKESFPVLGKLLAISLALPVSTADCERGFSQMKITKTELRNRMKKETLASLMRICIEGPHISDFDFVKVAMRWLGEKNRHTAKLKDVNELTELFTCPVALCNISFLINSSFIFG